MIARAPSDYSCLLSLMSLSLSPTPQQTALTASLGLLHLVGTLTGREELYSFYTLIASFPSRTAISTPELSIALSLGCNPAIIPASWTFSSYCNSYVFSLLPVWVNSCGTGTWVLGSYHETQLPWTFPSRIFLSMYSVIFFSFDYSSELYLEVLYSF